MEESGHFALAVYNALRAVVSGGSCVFGRALPCSNDGEEPHGSSPFPSCHPKEQNFLHPPFDLRLRSNHFVQRESVYIPGSLAVYLKPRALGECSTNEQHPQSLVWHKLELLLHMWCL